MRAFLRALDRHWFEPGSLRDLALARIFIVATTWYFVLPRSLESRLSLLGDHLYMPLPALKVLLLPLGWGARPSPELLMAFVVLAHLGAFLALIGLFSRTALGVLAYTTTALITHGYSYGELHHPQTLIVIMLWVLTVAPVGHALSVDAIRRRWRRVRVDEAFEASPAGSDRSIHARWPLRLGQWLLALAYLSAAISKIDWGSLAWMNGTTLAYYLAYDGLMWDRPLGVLAAQIPWLMIGMSIFAILFEGTFWMAIAVPRVTWLYLAAGVGLHLGIYVLQAAPFFTFMGLYIVFLPQLRENAARLRARFRRRVPEPGTRTAVVYDGLCPLCIRTMAVVDVIDGGRRLEYLDLERDWGRIAELAPSITRDDALAAMHVVTSRGEVHRGFDAFRAVAAVTPALRAFAPLLHLPPIPQLGRGVYRWVARRRPRRLCRDVCEL